MGTVDEDQRMGRVSIQCECGFHETGMVYPAISSSTPTKPEDAPNKLIPPGRPYGPGPDM